ncbi:MAG: flagellar hook-basal body complex protein FliE, partial [Planctomycetota bacterium]
MQPITNAPVGAAALTTPIPATEPTDEASFKDALLQSIDEVNTVQHEAQQAVETLMTGGDADPAEVLTAVQKADLAFRMMMQMRNKMM